MLIEGGASLHISDFGSSYFTHFGYHVMVLIKIL
jgi:hypothetical protein